MRAVFPSLTALLLTVGTGCGTLVSQTGSAPARTDSPLRTVSVEEAPQSSIQAVSETRTAELARSIFAPAIEEYRIPGLVVGVTFRGVHEFFANGLASREGQIAASLDTIFELGSISKVFTATLATLAERRGLLDLDASVASRIPELENTAFGNLRLMDLATHTSGGLPLQVPESVEKLPDLIDWVAKWKPSQEGTRSYSNIGIGLLGHITANALSTSYAKAVEQELFPLMGLRSTWVQVPKNASHNYAFGYDRKTDGAIRVTPGLLADEAYGVKSSAQDMLRLLDIQLGHANVTPELRAAVDRTRQGQTRTSYYVQAMIWEQYHWPVALEKMVKANSYDFILNPQPVEELDPPLPPQQNVILSKTGSTNGSGAYVVLLPGEDLGVVVLANRNYPNPARVQATYHFVKEFLKFGAEKFQPHAGMQ